MLVEFILTLCDVQNWTPPGEVDLGWTAESASWRSRNARTVDSCSAAEENVVTRTADCMRTRPPLGEGGITSLSLRPWLDKQTNLSLFSLISYFRIIPFSGHSCKHIPDMAPPGVDIEVCAVTDTSAITIPEPLLLAGIGKRRTAYGKLVAGIAAVADVESFKGATSHSHKPLARRWDRMFACEQRHGHIF